MAVAAAELAEFAKGFHCAQIICGDFNSHPDSIVYHMLSSGRLDHKMVDAVRNSDSNLVEEVRLSTAYIPVCTHIRLIVVMLGYHFIQII